MSRPCALERRALQRASEVDDHPIALLDLAALPLAGNGGSCAGDPLVALAPTWASVTSATGVELDALEIGRARSSEDLDRERRGKIALPADDLGDLGLLVVGNRDLGFHGELQTMIRDDLGVELAISASMVSAITALP